MRSNYSIRRYAFTTLALCSLVSLPACSLLGMQDLNTRQRHNASSVVDFLYPNRDNVAEKPGIPTLTLPLRVGIAFVRNDGLVCYCVSTEMDGVTMTAEPDGTFSAALHVPRLPLLCSRGATERIVLLRAQGTLQIG